MKSDFLFDLTCFLPLGWIFSLIDERLKFFWLIKLLRIKYIKFFLTQKFYDEMIESYINFRQAKSLMDEEKRQEMNEDLTYIS